MDTVGHARNLAILTIPPDIIVDLLICGNEFRVLSRGLPHGTKFKSATYDQCHDLFAVVVEHESFPPVPDGGEIPKLEPMVIAKKYNAIRGSFNGT